MEKPPPTSNETLPKIWSPTVEQTYLDGLLVTYLMRNMISTMKEMIGRTMIDIPENPRFDGSDYVPERDDKRLKGQLLKIVECMKDGRWRTLPEIAYITKAPTTSVSAQLRHLRKKRFGSHFVNKDYMGNGLWLYQLILRKKTS